MADGWVELFDVETDEAELLFVSMSSELSVAGASSPRRAVSPRPPRTSSADFKRLIRLVVPKIKLGSDVSVVKKQYIALAKSL